MLGLIVTVAAVALAGCGGSSATSSTGDTPAESAATKARFVAQAEAICQKLAAQEKPLKLRQESTKHLSVRAAEKAFISLVDQLVDFSNDAGRKLAALPRPPAEKARIDQLLEAFRAETADVGEIARAVSRHETANGEAAAESLKRSVSNNSTAAKPLGMNECLG